MDPSQGSIDLPKAAHTPRLQSSAVETTMNNEKLINHIHHEHDHLTRLFDDVYRTFEKLSEGALDDETEALESASDDLRIALDEMMQHFAEEEEVLFVEIEKHFPQMSDEIASLVQTHEAICDETRWLQKLLTKSPDAIREECSSALDVLDNLREDVRAHSKAESQVYNNALRQLPPSERRRMMQTLQSI